MNSSSFVENLQVKHRKPSPNSKVAVYEPEEFEERHWNDLRGSRLVTRCVGIFAFDLLCLALLEHGSSLFICAARSGHGCALTNEGIGFNFFLPLLKGTW